MCTHLKPHELSLNTTARDESENYSAFTGVYGEYFSIEFTEKIELLRNPDTPSEQPHKVAIKSGKKYPAVRASVYVSKHNESFPWILVYVPAYADDSIQRWLGCHEGIFADIGAIIHESRTAQSTD